MDTETKARLLRFVQGETSGALSFDEQINRLIDELEMDFPAMQHICKCDTGDAEPVDTAAPVASARPQAYRAQNDARFLSQSEEAKNAEAYALRQAGTDWPELAQFLGLSYTGGRARLKMWSLRNAKKWPIPLPGLRDYIPNDLLADAHKRRQAGESWQNIVEFMGLNSISAARKRLHTWCSHNAQTWPIALEHKGDD